VYYAVNGSHPGVVWARPLTRDSRVTAVALVAAALATRASATASAASTYADSVEITAAAA